MFQVTKIKKSVIINLVDIKKIDINEIRSIISLIIF